MNKKDVNSKVFAKALLYPVGIYWLLMTICFFASAIAFRIYPNYQKWVALIACSITATIIAYTLLLTIVFIVLKKSIIIFIIPIIFGCIISIIVGLGFPYDVYHNPENWITMENFVVGLFIIIIIIFITFLRHVPSASWHKVVGFGDQKQFGGFVRHATKKEAEERFGDKADWGFRIVGILVSYFLYEEIIKFNREKVTLINYMTNWIVETIKSF